MLKKLSLGVVFLALAALIVLPVYGSGKALSSNQAALLSPARSGSPLPAPVPPPPRASSLVASGSPLPAPVPPPPRSSGSPLPAPVPPPPVYTV